MIVVADTTPVNYLLVLGRVEVLQALYGRVIIPKAVLEELEHPLAPHVVREWARALPGWVEVQEPRPPLDLPDLGRGEQEALALAMLLPADFLLVDDASARREAEKRGIEITGTVGVLEQAAEKGLLSLPETVEALRQTSYRIHKEVLEEALVRDRARRQAQEAAPEPSPPAPKPDHDIDR